MNFAQWDAQFVNRWVNAGTYDMVKADRLFYYNSGYTPRDAVWVCSDVDPTNY